LGLDSKSNFNEEVDNGATGNNNFYKIEDLRYYQDLSESMKRVLLFNNFKEILINDYFNK